MNKLDHQRILEIISNRIVKNYPNLSLAVSGSVALGTYRLDSDIDLLIVDSNISKSFQFVCFYQEIKVNFLCFKPNYISETSFMQLKKWLYSYNVTLFGYLFPARSLNDPSKIIDKLVNDAKSIIAIKQIQKSKLKTELLNEITFLFKDLINEENTFIKHKYYLNILDRFIAFWFLKNNMYLSRKEQYYFVFNIIKNKDPEYYHLLTSCFPIKINNLKVINDILNNIGINI